MSAAPLVNTVVGACYRLLRPLGQGGMGTVYEAQHLRLGGTVAVKILAPQYAADPKFRDRFKREAKAASQIRHPNVVQITDFGETPNGSVFFAMERLEGHDLHQVLRVHGPAPFPWPRAVHLLAQAADALAAAHRCGIIHRDVKPSNIFVLEGAGLQDFVKLLDFGIAKIVAPTLTADSALVKNLTGTGEIFGTAKYMAPEQAYGGAQDPRMDVYSLGVVAYELLTGRVPFTGQSSFEIITRHVSDSPRPLRELRPDLPAALEAVVLRAMEKKPENRFSTMEEFGQALRQVGAAIPTARAHTDTNANTMPRGQRRDLLPIEPTTVRKPMQGPVAPVPAASIVRKTIPVIAVAPSPPQAAGPAQLPIGAPFVAPPPAANPPGANRSPPPPTDNLARVQPPTGPLARRADSAYDDTARDRAMRPPAAPRGAGRTVAFVLLGAIAIASLSATAAALVLSSSEEEPASTEARAPMSDPPAVELRPPATPAPAPGSPPTRATGPLATGPAVDAPALTGTSEPGVGSRENPEVVAPVPTPDVAAPPPIAEPSRRDPKPGSTKSSKPRPSPPASAVDPDPDGEIAKQIGGEIGKKIRQDCWKHGEGKKYYIRLQIDDEGHVVDKTIAAMGSLRACIEETIGEPQFPAKKRPVTLSPVIGECVEAYGSTVSKCK